MEFDSLFGPSGKLRQLIERGETFSLFLSASKRHTDALLDQGRVRDSEIFTRNALCLMVETGRAVDAGGGGRRHAEPVSPPGYLYA